MSYGIASYVLQHIIVKLNHHFEHKSLIDQSAMWWKQTFGKNVGFDL